MRGNLIELIAAVYTPASFQIARVVLAQVDYFCNWVSSALEWFSGKPERQKDDGPAKIHYRRFGNCGCSLNLRTVSAIASL